MSNEKLSLGQLQNWMQLVILPHTTQVNDDLYASIPDGLLTEDVVNHTKKLDARQHMAIYRQSYIARLRECMKNQFGALAHALGGELFEMFADQYLDAYPSESYTLNNLGQHFARFLQETRPDADAEEKESWPDFMIELARFEYALAQIFDMHETHEPETAIESSADEVLMPAPTLQLFQHHYPICSYYLAYADKKEPELPMFQASYCAVVRQNYRLALYHLQPAQYYFLLHMQQGCSVAEAITELSNGLGFEPEKVKEVWQIWRKNFIASGFFVL